ncbi:unnamed protein product, partial [Adineta steineri]
LRQRLTRTQAGYKASDQFLMDVDENDDTANGVIQVLRYPVFGPSVDNVIFTIFFLVTE